MVQIEKKIFISATPAEFERKNSAQIVEQIIRPTGLLDPQIDVRPTEAQVQNLILENRGKLSISGVLDVLSFDDQVIMVETELGLLTIKGENLRITKLSIDTSEVIVEGNISYLAYSNKEVEKNKGSIISKIFK